MSARIQSLSQTLASMAAFELFVNGDGVNLELILAKHEGQYLNKIHHNCCWTNIVSNTKVITPGTLYT